MVFAVSCSSDAECQGVWNTRCVADYCQPSPCTSSSQCVEDQKCSKLDPRNCVCESSFLHCSLLGYFAFLIDCYHLSPLVSKTFSISLAVTPERALSFTFADPIKLDADEGDDITLRFSDPGKEGAYHYIKWFKGSELNSIVHFEKSENRSFLQFYDPYCAASCNASDRCELLRNFSLRVDFLYLFEMSFKDLIWKSRFWGRVLTWTFSPKTQSEHKFMFC